MTDEPKDNTYPLYVMGVLLGTLSASEEKRLRLKVVDVTLNDPSFKIKMDIGRTLLVTVKEVE